MSRVPPTFVASRLALLGAVALAGCLPSGGDPTGSAARPRTAAVTPSSSAAVADASATPLPALPGEPPSLRLEPVADGLVDPIGIGNAADGSGWLFVLERAGVVRALPLARPAPGRSVAPFLDISDRVRGGGEQGLLGIAFHPEYERNGRLFLHYTALDGDAVIAEYRATSDHGAADRATERVLMRLEDPAPNHNGGTLAFGPDGYLYIGLGDGGGAGDQFGHGQDPVTLLGSILRIDVDGGEPYAIPLDNPFRDGVAGGPEVWAYGLRNPWRFSFDRANGDLYIGDVGQNAWEEIDRQPVGGAGGDNYGWSVMEGFHCFRAQSCDQTGLVAPVAVYPLADGNCAVIGGYVYRGAAIADLQGTYLFADHCSGRMWSMPGGVAAAEPRLVMETGLRISSFGEDEAGELYVVDLGGGGLYQIVAAP